MKGALAVAVLTLAAGFALKAPCLTAKWGAPDYLQYGKHCYNDIQPLYAARGLDQRKFPYVEQKPFEYPALVGLTMWAASHVSRTHAQFFLVNAALLAIAGLLALWGLARAGVGARAWWFALAPPLALYAFMNWDLLAVAPLALAMWAWTRRRDFGAGALLGLGAAAKLFPAYALPPLLIARTTMERGDPAKRAPRWRGPLLLVLGFALAWSAVNVPVMWLDWESNGTLEGWLSTFEFHARRVPDFDTLWYWLSALLGGANTPPWLRWLPILITALLTVFSTWMAWVNDRAFGPIAFGGALATGLAWIVMSSPALGAGPSSSDYKDLVDRVSLVFFAVGTLILTALQWHRGENPWATAGAIVALFLLVSKVHSPQYTLWLLPFFVAVETPAWMILAYFSADAALFASRFSWYAASPALQEHPWQTALMAAVFARATMLVGLLGWYAFAATDRIRSLKPAAKTGGPDPGSFGEPRLRLG